MDATYLRELVSGLQADHEQGESPGGRLCRACVDLLAVGSAGIMLMDEEGNGTSLGLSDGVIRVVEDLQFTLGEGPGIDAHAQGRPVLEPRLGNPAADRWPTFAPAAVDAGVQAGFGFPLHVGAISLGSLDLYQPRPGPLNDTQMADAISMADFIARAVITIQAGADPGELVAEMTNPRDLRTQVHQASGMISEQLGVGIGDALIRLRAYAYAEGHPIDEVARDVVDRRLKLP
jgi:GAF domain-containing protein